MVNWLERAKTTFRKTPDRPTAITDDRSLPPAPEAEVAGTERPRVDLQDREPYRADDAERSWIGSSSTATPLVCFACHERRFWLSIHGVTICGLCHPPADEKLVAAWIESRPGVS